MKKSFFMCLIAISFLASFMLSCDNEPMEEEDPEEETTIIQESYFNTSSLVSFTTVDCTLEDGSSGECYQIIFSSNPVDNGPYCPETIDDIGGVGVYDGATNPGFQVMKASLFNAMEADGYDIVDDDGNIYLDDFASGPVNADYAYCLEAAPDDDLQLTFLLPKNPVMATSNNDIGTVELIGVSVDGVPINGDPPSVVSGPPGQNIAGGNIPSIDPCGGHMDPAGYYHWHFVAETMNQVLDEYGITEVSCTLVEQTTSTKLIGFAKDGFPIYAYSETPTDLDDCGGRTASTTEYPDAVYHYVASNTEAPNVPKCLKGVSANNNFRFQ